MKLRILILVVSVLAGLLSVNDLFGQSSLMKAALEAEKRAKEIKSQEAERYAKVLDSRNLEQYNEFIRDYPRSKNTVEIKKRIAEMELWQMASTSNTVSAYQNYLSKTKYHWFDDSATLGISRIRKAEEKRDWEAVCRIGTITAYQNYLKQKPMSAYREDAEKIINRLKGAEAWKSIRFTSDKKLLEAFVERYPHADETVEARLRLHELYGKEYYDQQDFRKAYAEFSYFSSRDRVSYENRNAYDAVMEWKAFSLLDSDSSETELNSFLNKYPNSIYKTQVNNLLAIVKAKALDNYASVYDYNQIRGYASDTETRRIVESYIASNKSKKKIREKNARKRLRNLNGGLFNMGIEFLDLGWNGESDDSQSIYYYNLGASIRIGNYASKAQFVCGLKLGAISYYTQENGDYSEYTSLSQEAVFHMPVYAQLKFNLFQLSSSSRFFISGQYQYNAVRDDLVENTMSWNAGVGIAWRHLDWLFYYRQEFGSNYLINQNFFGTSLIYYFKL